jgi:hypothetical protein
MKSNKSQFSRRQFIKAGAAGTFLICSPKTAFTYTNNDKSNALLSREPRKGWEFGYA